MFHCSVIYNFLIVQIVKPIQGLIKKGVVYRWEKREKDAFSHIKKVILEAPALYNPYFTKYFFLYTFAYDTSLVVMLTQKDDQNNERPIYFMSTSLL